MFQVQRIPVCEEPPSQAVWEDYSSLQAALISMFEEIPEYATSTPDYPALAKYDSHFLFVYDGMKKNFRHDKHLLGSPCVAVGYTKSYYTMYKEVINGRYQQPVVLPYGSTEQRAPVYGEIYKVTPNTLAELDWKESNGPIVTRKRVFVEAIVSKSGTTRQLCPWMYVHRPEYWDNRMDRLSIAQQLTANSSGQKYYSFLKKDEQVLQ